MIGTVRGVFTVAGAGIAGLLCLDLDPDRRGNDRRLLGRLRAARRRRADDGAVTALRRVDEVGVAADLCRRLPDRLPARARLRRLGAARRTAGRELVPAAHGQLVGPRGHRRTRRRPARATWGCSHSGWGSSSASRSTRPAPSFEPRLRRCHRGSRRSRLRRSRRRSPSPVAESARRRRTSVPSAQGSRARRKLAIQEAKMSDLAVIAPAAWHRATARPHALPAPPRLPAAERLRAELGGELSESAGGDACPRSARRAARRANSSSP